MKFISWSYLSLFLGVVIALPAEAQITTDGTTSTTLTPTDNGITIEDGDRAGNNLFHSFGEFSVPVGNEAFFNNSSDVINIFSRVTGGNISNIDGLIRANNANLFLINPAGILFGTGASLDLGGSFYGSTADSILFPGGEEFSAVNPQQPVLTINAPIGLSFRDEPGDIVNQSPILTTAPGATLALIGGDINFNGGRINALGGKLELGSVKSESIVNLNQTPLGFIANYDGVSNFGNIRLENGSQISSLTPGNFDGQDIVINAGKLFINNQSTIVSTTVGGGNGGNIKINARDGVEITGTGFEEFLENILRPTLNGETTIASFQQGTTGIISVALAEGKAGNTIINTSSLRMRDGALLLNPTFSPIPQDELSETGKAGDIHINASESVELIGSSILAGSAANSTARGGEITIEAKNLEARDGGAIVNAALGSGDGGNIEINIEEDIVLSNTPETAIIPTGILTNSSSIPGSSDIGDAGNIIIKAANLFTDKGAVITNNSGAILLDSGDRRSGGNAGNINIIVSNLADLSGVSPNGITTSGIGSGALGEEGNAGDIIIETKDLIVRDGASIDAATTGSGQGGIIKINASESITISGTEQLIAIEPVVEIPSNISATSGREDFGGFEGATGRAGNVEITTKELIIRDGARVSVDSFNDGDAGELIINAESISLENQGTINASTNAQDSSGENDASITLNVTDTLELKDNSNISARANNNADGGNVTIDAGFIIAFPGNNDIIASADRGTGGEINIIAEGIFGLEERTSSDTTNDIDASSKFGLDGDVVIIRPDAAVFKEAIEAAEIISLQTVGADACSAKQTRSASSFAINGKGGVPPEITDSLNSDSILTEEKLIVMDREGKENIKRELIKPIATAEGKIYPARGVVVKANGDILLTSYATNNIQRAPHNSSYCRKSG